MYLTFCKCDFKCSVLRFGNIGMSAINTLGEEFFKPNSNTAVENSASNCFGKNISINRLSESNPTEQHKDTMNNNQEG